MRRTSNHQHKQNGINVSKIAIALTFLACFALVGPATGGFIAFGAFSLKALLVSLVIGTAIGAFVDTMLEKNRPSNNNRTRITTHARNVGHVIGTVIKFILNVVANSQPDHHNTAKRRPTQHTTRTATGVQSSNSFGTIQPSIPSSGASVAKQRPTQHTTRTATNIRFSTSPGTTQPSINRTAAKRPVQHTTQTTTGIQSKEVHHAQSLDSDHDLDQTRTERRATKRTTIKKQ